MKRTSKWISIWLVFALVLAACGDASNYIKHNYSLIDVQGQGKSTAKIYSVEGKDVPTVAKEIAAQEKPEEISKESAEQMFLVYNNKIVNVQKDTENESNTLVQVDSIEYAKEHYDSSFLEGYIAATLLQSLFGSSWSNKGTDYRGYTSTKTYTDSGKNTGTAAKSDTKQTPTTSSRTGSFTTSGSAGKSSGTTSSSSSSSKIRKSDGSTPTFKSTPKSIKPKTSSRSGSFRRR
ncbi:DUF4247 domain-containing protein [Paenibacillus ginsengihumi]|uniref:DUF4247 domain-containing protein n=1 Tax=Paenibacillus ginsengihumi TaxID=431596 RepID=UPI000381DD84|nr:DUF4247 domain-containing protein [Paenibacillus ginsengihumi]